MSDNYTGKRSAGKIVQIVLAVLACLALAAAGILFLQTREREPAAPKGVQVGNNGQPADSGAGSSADSAALSSQSFDEVPPAPAAPLYDFSQPAPEGEAVDNSYFADAAFVGDSRTDGFMLYSGVGCGKNLTSNGLSIFKLAEKKVLTIGGEQYTLLEALALEEYGKVYLSLGVNELGLKNDNGFYESYCEAIDAIRLVQPGAVIYIQGLIPVNEEQAEASTGHDYLKNDHLRVYNDLMRQIAEEKQVAFLDLYSEFADENGSLPKEASRDGIHLVKESCQRWLDYLKTHTADFDALYPDGPPMPEPADPAPVEPDTTTADGSERG